MGRIKTNLTKRAAISVYKSNNDLFKSNFEENKNIVSSLLEFRSKKLRNIVAGYVTRLAQQKND